MPGRAHPSVRARGMLTGVGDGAQDLVGVVAPSTLASHRGQTFPSLRGGREPNLFGLKYLQCDQLVWVLFEGAKMLHRTELETYGMLGFATSS